MLSLCLPRACSPETVDHRTKHRRLKRQPSEWTDKRRVYSAFDEVFQRYQGSIIVVSYRSDSIPSESELVSLLGKYKRCVRVEHYGQYKYVLSTNAQSKEILVIGTENEQVCPEQKMMLSRHNQQSFRV